MVLLFRSPPERSPPYSLTQGIKESKQELINLTNISSFEGEGTPVWPLLETDDCKLVDLDSR